LCLTSFLRAPYESPTAGLHDTYMNTSDVFYIVAIVFMVVHLIIVTAIAVTIIGVIKKVHTVFDEVYGRITNFKLATYGVQIAVLKSILNFFTKGGER
jgi:NADH:ubiquinone oxidoreductase subunit 3 (subunit A)